MTRVTKRQNHKPALKTNGKTKASPDAYEDVRYGVFVAAPAKRKGLFEAIVTIPVPPLRAHDYLPHTRIGDLVQFYSDSLRAGHIESISKGIAKIRPIAPYKAGPSRLVKKPLTELIICARPPHGEGHQ